MNYALYLLTDREQCVIKALHIDKIPLSRLCGDENMTAEFVMLIERNAIKKFNQPNIAGYILNGIVGFTTIQENKAYRLGFECGYSAGVENRKIISMEEETFSPLIEELNLPKRALNCLKKAGVVTINDCIKIKAPMRISFLGITGAKQIAVALKEKGIVGTQWDEYIEDSESEENVNE